MSDADSERPKDRLPTGVPGLDAILHGGLLSRGVYLLQGRPGAGKTILANQICYHHASEGGRVVYATLLAETHERMLFNLEQLSFFDVSRIPEQVSYVSAYMTLEESGLKGLVELLRRESRARRATLLVVDGLVAVEETAGSRNEFKKLIHELQVHANLLGCTVLLLSSSTEPVGAEHTMVDGVLEVCDRRVARTAERELEVKKFRGSGYVRGAHVFQITDEGIVLYPRLEGLLQDPSPETPRKAERVSCGIAGLDRAMHGGLPHASSTVIFGPTGTGKTVMGLQFLNASSASEPGLYFGFYEPPPHLLLKSRALGLDLEAKHQQGLVHFLWNPPTERLMDALGHKLVSAVREHGIKRLFVDGIDGFLQATAHPERLGHFLSALTNELRSRGVTTLYTAELQDLFSTQVQVPMRGISSLVENIFLLRFVEQRTQLLRMLTIVKVRDSDYDSTMRELRITSHGAEIGAPLDSEPSQAAGSAGTTLKWLWRRRGQ